MAEVGGSNLSSLTVHAIALPTRAAASQFVLAIGLNAPERVHNEKSCGGTVKRTTQTARKPYSLSMSLSLA
jgi:DNA-binding IclR family transcriptional regulator